MLGHQGAPAQAVLDALAQGIGSADLAVHHIDLARRGGQGAQPGLKLGRIGMGRRRQELDDLGADTDVLAVDAHRGRAAGQRGAAPGDWKPVRTIMLRWFPA